MKSLSSFLGLLLVTGCLHAQTNPTYYIPYAIEQPHPTNCINGFGKSQTGDNEPDYDTLIGFTNSQFYPQIARIRAYNQQGQLQLWNGVDHWDQALAPGHSWAMTFIPGNPIAIVPENWKGYATVESLQGGPLTVFSMLGGGGCFPAYWNTYSAALGVIPSPIAPRAATIFPYMNVVWTTDANHPTGYSSHIAVTNFDTRPVNYKVTYTIGDGYAGAGLSYSWSYNVAPSNSVDFDVYTQAHLAGYTATLSEGHLEIDSLNADGTPAFVKTGACFTQGDQNQAVFSAGYCF